jgi:aldehyde:ferredoxin oxidoreductase
LFMIDGGDWTLTDVTGLFNAITGWEFSVEELMLTGERGFTVQRMNNLRDGYNASNDVMPKKMRKVAKEGFRAGKEIPFAEMMQEYYALRGWDSNGAPNSETLSRLGL